MDHQQCKDCYYTYCFWHPQFKRKEIKMMKYDKILIDINFIAFRSYFTHKELSFNGVGTGMCYGTIQTLFYLFCKYGWDSNRVILIGDGRPNWKYDLFPAYKEGRKKDENVPPAMSVPTQLKLTSLILFYLGLQQVRNKEEEADDVIMSMCKKLVLENSIKSVLIVANDHDIQQCLNESEEAIVNIMEVGDKGERIVTEDIFVHDTGIFPEDYWKVQTLSGCPTDKVPGMEGIAEKRALAIVKMNDFKKVISNDPSLVFPDKATKTAFQKNYSTWNYNRDYKLVKLKTDVPFEIKKTGQQKDKLKEWFTKLGFEHYLREDHFGKLLKTFA